MKIKKDIKLYGLPRSGGTFIWHIFREIFENENEDLPPQTHNPIYTDAKNIVIVFRDFRAVAFSHWRIFKGKMDSSGKLLSLPTDEEIFMACVDVKRRLKNMYPYLSLDNNKLVLRYEDFVFSPLYVIKKIEKHYDIKVNDETRRIIIDSTNLKKNEDKSSQLLAKSNIADFFKTYDISDHIHAGHVFSPKPECYKKYLTKEQLKIMNKELKFELEVFGYGVD